MLFFTWLYGVQNTQRPRFDRDMEREDLHPADEPSPESLSWA